VCALLHRISPWLVCECAALRRIGFFAGDCSCLFVSLRCLHAGVTAALQWECGVVLRVLLVAAAIAGSLLLVRHVSCDRACRSRGVALL
jgi:hypothetical protein